MSNTQFPNFHKYKDIKKNIKRTYNSNPQLQPLRVIIGITFVLLIIFAGTFSIYHSIPNSIHDIGLCIAQIIKFQQLGYFSSLHEYKEINSSCHA